MKIVDTKPAIAAELVARRARVERALPANTIDGERPRRDVQQPEQNRPAVGSAPCHIGTDRIRVVPQPQFQAAFVAQVLGQMLGDFDGRRMRAADAYAAHIEAASRPTFVDAV